MLYMKGLIYMVIISVIYPIESLIEEVLIRFIDNLNMRKSYYIISHFYGEFFYILSRFDHLKNREKMR